MTGPSTARLRPVEPGDVAIFFEHQADPQAAAMAGFPARDRAAHDAHWERLLADDTPYTRTIVLPDGRVAGNIGSWMDGGERYVGYWLGREHWGQGHASRAVAAFLAEVPERPVYAHVVDHNVASLRVLERCGFVVAGEEREPGEAATTIILRLS